MVQREVADRFFAAPGTKDYGAVSVLVQLAAERTGFHPVSRTVFRPPPNVDSALVAFRRTELPESFAPDQAGRHGRVQPPAEDAPELARARRSRLAGAGGGGARGARPAGEHARRGARAARVRRARGGARMMRAPAAAKINLALVVGPTRDDGKHEVLTVLQRIDLVDRIEIDGGADASRRRLQGRHARPHRARAPRGRRRSRAALAREDREAHPARGGARRRQLRRRDRASPRERLARRAARRRRVARSRGGNRRRRPVLPRRRPAARLRRRQRARAARAAAGLLGRRPPPTRHGEELDRGRLRSVRRARAARAAGTSAAQRSSTRWRGSRARSTSPLSRRTTSRARRSPTRSAPPGAFRADVSGAGPALYGLFLDRPDAEAARRSLSALRRRPGSRHHAWYG